MLQSAAEHYRRQQRLALLAVAAGKRAWRLINPDTLDVTAPYLVSLLPVLMAAQRRAADQGARYVGAALSEQGIRSSPAGAVNTAALAGTSADGRPLFSLLGEPVIRVKSALKGGARTPDAMGSGLASLTRILHTEVADAGRVATGVGIAATPGAGWVRMLNLPSCKRCVPLAGKFFRYNQGFQRHPGCDCQHIPTSESVAGDLTTDPRAAFESGQIKDLSRAETAAIREGADINQVVNARRGMSTAGGRKTTTEGTTRRGIAHRPGATRLMPEQIYKDASSRAETIRMLRLHGYIL